MYPSAAALVAGASGDARAALDALDAAQQDTLRTAAIVAVEEHCHQSFTAVTEARVFDTVGGSRLLLDQRLAVLDTVQVWSTSLIAADFRLSRDRSVLTIAPIDTSTAYLRAMVELDPDMRSRHLPDRNGSATVTGTWGWLSTEMPAGVAVALRIDMEDNALADSNALSSSVQSFRAMGLRSIRQGNLSADLLGHTPGLSARAKRALAGLVWNAHGGVA